MTDETRPIATGADPDPAKKPAAPAAAEPAAEPTPEPAVEPAPRVPLRRRPYAFGWLVATGLLGLVIGGLGGALVHDAVVHSERGWGDHRPTWVPGQMDRQDRRYGPGEGSGGRWGAPQEQGPDESGQGSGSTS